MASRDARSRVFGVVSLVMTTPLNASLRIRPAVEADLPELNAIFNYYVAHSACVWTTQPVSREQRFEWFRGRAAPISVLAAELDGTVVGWAALSWFKTAATFHRVVEDSVYVHPEFHRRGIGRTLLRRLIASARECELSSIVALISDDQLPSIELHRREGFREQGRLVKVGFKFGRWYDAVYLQLPL